MRDASEAIAEPTAVFRGPDPAPITCIELDRFCEDCGYNLRTQPVFRDAGTGIHVVRCTECGKFQPANDGSTALRPWLNRVTSVMLIVWMLAIVAIFFHLGLGEGAISYATLDELTMPAGSRIEKIGRTMTRTWSGSGPLEVVDYPDYRLFITAVTACSIGIAFVCGALAVVMLPHWPRAAGIGLVVALPLVAGSFVGLAWNYEAPHLLGWGLQYIGAHAGVQVLGGVIGVIVGRPLARLAVQILLPSGVRPRLAYLWLADHKPFPNP